MNSRISANAEIWVRISLDNRGGYPLVMDVNLIRGKGKETNSGNKDIKGRFGCLLYN